MKNHTIVSSNNSLQTNKSYLNTRASKQQKSLLDEKFDELLNEKCSWSYRSQMSTGNKDTENHAEKFQPMQTTLAFEISENKCEKALNDISPSINSENCLHDDSPTTREGNNNGLLQGTLHEGNYFQVKTYSRENRIPKSKCKTINLKLSTSHSNKTKTTKILMNESTVSSASSSDDEVLQTRFSVKKKSTFEVDESCRNGKNSILSVTALDEGSSKENDFNVKTSPIIIHATAFDGRNVPNNSNDMEKVTVTKQQDMNKNEINMEITSTDSISVEANYSNSDNKSNSMEISNDNRKECHDSKDYLDKKINHDILLKQLMKHITPVTEQDSIAIDLKKSKVAPDNLNDEFLNGSFDISTYQAERRPSITNFKKSILQQDPSSAELEKSKLASADIIEKFLNGSFDISAYHSEKPSVKELERSLYSNIVQFENKSISTQKNNKNIQKRNKNDKRIITELVTTNKKHKKNYSYNNEGGLFENSPEILTSGMNKESNIRHTKNTKTQQRGVKKRSKQSINKKSEQGEEFQLKRSSKAKKIYTIQQRNKAKDASFDRDEHDLTNNKLNDSSSKTSYVKRNTSRKKCKDNSTTAEALNSSSLTKHSTRKVRNSSLIASRKIKEIEKLENVSDFYEEILIDSEEEVHYTSTPYSFKGFKNYFQTGKACTNKMKAKNENNKLNKDKKKLRAEHAVQENFKSEDTSQYYSRQDEMKNFEPTRYNITHSENLLSKSFKALYSKSGSSSLIDKHPMQENNRNSGEILQNSFTKGSRKNVTGSKNAVDTFYLMNEKEPTNTFNKATKRKPRTWEMLERDLMNELDEMPLTENASKTFILKEVVREKKLVNDTNLFTVSNTSMMQTISALKTGNQYNMQYEIKNTESQFLESKARTSCNLQKEFDIPHSKEILPGNSQNKSILDRAISAMEKCTRKFLLPEAKICDYEQKDGGFQFGDISDNSEVNHETQLHSSITFMANDNKQCYSNRTVHYLKKSGRRHENINFEQKSNVVNVLSNFREKQQKGDQENSDTEYSEQYISGNRNYLLENHSQKNTCNKKNHVAVPFPGDKQTDIWSRLMNKLDLEADYEKDKNACLVPYPMNISVTDENVKEQHSELQMIKSDMKSSSNNAKRNDKKLILLDFKANETKFDEKTQSKEGVHLQIPNKIAQSFISPTCDSKSINSEERLSYKTQLENNKEHENVRKGDESMGKDDENVKNSRLGKPLKETEDKTKITEKQTLKKSEKKTARRSPKYNFNIDRDGTLKIKANRSSSASNSSKGFTKSPNITLNDSESYKCSNYKTNKSKEKYRRYLQRVYVEIEKDKIDDKNEPKELQSKAITEKNQNQGKNNERITRLKLIAQNEDDIFSLSSSDSETGKNKTPGSGLLCDLFDE